MNLPLYLCTKLIKMKKISWLILIGVCISIFSFSSCFNESEYFDIANQRLEKYKPKNKNLVIIVDYRKNILSKRLYVLDMKNKKIILESRVSHAWNSGFLYVNDYSNLEGSNKSSRGNFITRGTKYGKYGYSMIIDGLDGKLNNKVKNRSVIFHSSNKMPTIWSLGCFATPEDTNKKIIDLTKNGVLVCVIDL